MTTICLNMIVKNEARIIRRCLDSLLPYLDHWVIVDTGSTDGTQDVIREALRAIPGELHERPWKNFGHNRTEAIRLAEGKADYLLLCDADMSFVTHDESWKSGLSADAYLVRQRHGSLSYGNIRLINARTEGDRRWRYWGATHEYVDFVKPGEFCSKQTLDSVEFLDFADGGSKSDKYVRDARLLEAEIAEIEAFEQKAAESPDDAELQQMLAGLRPLMVRDVFYLAQTCRDMEDHEKSFALYQRRIDLGGWDEEVWVSRYEMAKLSERMGQPGEVAIARYLDAFEHRPQRAEPLVQVARWMREHGRHQLAHLFASKAVTIPQPPDILFVDQSVYDWRALDEYAVASYWCGHHAECIKACDDLLARPGLPDAHRQRVQENRAHAVAAMTGVGIDI